MARESAFLADIIEHPDDDAPRLIFADWLEENGDPDRAEFIRLQCRLARLDDDDPQREALQEREQELLGEHFRAWTARLPAWARKETHSYHRGFVSQINANATVFLRSAATLFKMAPVEAVTLYDAGDRIKELAACSHLDSVTDLTLLGIPDVKQVRALLASPHLGRLRALSLEGISLGAAGARVLADWPGLAQLTSLNLAQTDLRDADLSVLLGSPHLGQLEVLRLWGNELRPPAARTLAGCSRLAHLRVLDLKLNPIGNEGLAALAGSPHLAQLQALDLQGTATVEGIEALAASPHLGRLRTLLLKECRVDERGARALAGGRFPCLRELDLHGCNLRDAGVALAESALLAGLTSLNLDASGIGDPALWALTSSPWLGNLRTLNLGNAGLVTVSAIEALLSSGRLPNLSELLLHGTFDNEDEVVRLAGVPALRQLRKLNLAGCAIAARAARALAASPYLANLRQLHLPGNRIDSAGAVALASSPHLAGLTDLNLFLNRIDAEGVRALADSPHLARLRILRLSNNPIGSDGLAALADSPHLTRLLHLEVSARDSDLKPLRARFGHTVVNG
jgi:uncharacterized protein (TIGR02996 family)